MIFWLPPLVARPKNLCCRKKANSYTETAEVLLLIGKTDEALPKELTNVAEYKLNNLLPRIIGYGMVELSGIEPLTS